MVIALFAAPLWAAETAPEDHNGQIPAGLLRLGDGAFFPPYVLVVDKSKKKIYVVDNSTTVPSVSVSYDSDLGKNPGDKHSTGDSKTPEGIYFLDRILEGNALDPFKYGIKAFVTNYPNFFDQSEGKSGYGIWLHAIDDKVTLERGSKGCVVVRNDTIKKLSPFITLKETPLMIFDQVHWIPAESTKTVAESFLQILKDWKTSWEGKEIDKYIDFYAANFKFGKMNRDKYKQYKSELAQKYKDIKVSISMPVIYEHHNNVIVRFLQDYSSSEHSDYGEKTLYLTKNGDKYQIIGEEWEVASDPNTRSLLAGSKLCCQTKN